MKEIRKDIYTSIGMTTYAFVKGMPYSIDLLRTHLTVIEGMNQLGDLSTNEYEYYKDLLLSSIAFFDPNPQPTV